MSGISARGLDPLTNDEHTVLMQMSGDLAWSAAVIADNLAHEAPDDGWTARRVNAAHRGLRDKGYALFGPLWSEDDGLLRGCGYWLCGAGCDLRYKGRAA